MVVMRFLLEGCLEIGLSAMISIMMIEAETFKNFWEICCILTAIVSLFMLIAAPIYLTYISRQYLASKEQGNDISESMHHNLFSDYRPNESSLLYPVLFFFRRLTMILILTTMPGFKYAQILGHFVLTMSSITFLWSAHPYRSPFLNRQEILNELMVMLAAYPLYCFTPWVWDMTRRLELGWLIAFIIIFNIIFNISLLFYQIVKQTYLKIKYWWIRRRKIK